VTLNKVFGRVRAALAVRLMRCPEDDVPTAVHSEAVIDDTVPTSATGAGAMSPREDHHRDSDANAQLPPLRSESLDIIGKGGSVAPPGGKAAVAAAAELRRTVVVSLSVCSFYILISGSMVFVNKAITYNYGFRCTNILLLMQMFFTIALLRIARIAGVVTFERFERVKAMQVAPVSLFYSLNAAVALLALRELSVPSYTLIKRLSPLFTLALEYILLRKRTTPSIALSLVVMTSGTIMAANADTASALSSWILGLVSCIFQALYLTFVKRSGITTGMSSVSILYYHSILSLPFISMIILGVGELHVAFAYDRWASPSFLFFLALSLAMGLLLNYALFLCTELTSPTSTVVSGQVKAMAQTAIGMFTFGGVDANFRYLLGTVLNIGGGAGYAYSKYIALRQQSSY
jgi:solute carrier family 35